MPTVAQLIGSCPASKHDSTAYNSNSYTYHPVIITTWMSGRFRLGLNTASRFCGLAAWKGEASLGVVELGWQERGEQMGEEDW